MIKNNQLIQKLLSLNLPAEDYAVFGSGIMFAYGIKELGFDIDAIARGKAWEKAITLGDPVDSVNGGQVVRFFDGEVEVYNLWAPGKWDTDDLIDTAVVIEGMRFVSLDYVVRFKKVMGREKDFQHIKMIEDYLAKQ